MKDNMENKEYGFTVYERAFTGKSSEEKRKYISIEYVKIFLDELNFQQPGLGDSIQNIFVSGIFPEHWCDIKKSVIGKDGIGPIMAEKPFGQGRPWGHEFMDLLYRNVKPQNPLESILSKCISGEAVYNRKRVVVEQTNAALSPVKDQREHASTPAKIVNLGSACGDDMFELLESFPGLQSSVGVVNIDIAEEAVNLGQHIAQEKKMKGVSFVQGDMLKLHRKINGADIALLIGMLCGLGHKWGVKMLRSAKKYLNQKGLIMGACVTDKMVHEDLFTCFILEEILGWHLCYRQPADVESMFTEAGFNYQGYYTEGGEKFYCIGIGGVH